MSVHRLESVRTQSDIALIEQLAAEWTERASDTGEPVIQEETDRQGEVAHIYVVWSDWANLDRIRRSEIIMEAGERVMPPDDVMRITIAMGLTPDEADRFGLKWR